MGEILEIQVDLTVAAGPEAGNGGGEPRSCQFYVQAT